MSLGCHHKLISRKYGPLFFFSIKKINDFQVIFFLLYKLMLTSIGRNVDKMHSDPLWRACAQSVSCVRLFCDPMDCSLSGSSVYGISQARILEWVAISYSRGSSQPRDQTHISCISRWVLSHWATREIHLRLLHNYNLMWVQIVKTQCLFSRCI